MEIIEAFVVKNRCYQIGAPLYPQGIMLHSIGVLQPNAGVMARLKRITQLFPPTFCR